MELPVLFILSTDCVILGADYPDLPEFLEKVQRSVSQFVHPSIMENVSIRCTKLKEDTILLGGYYIARRSCLKQPITGKDSAGIMLTGYYLSFLRAGKDKKI